MKCKRVSDLISYYVSGELPDADARSIESHLAGCELCRLELESARRALRALQCPVTQLDPPDVAAAIRSQAAQRTPRAYLKWAPVAVAVLVIAVFLSLARLSPGTNRPATAKHPAPVVSTQDERSTPHEPSPEPSAVDPSTQDAPVAVEIPKKPRRTPKRDRPRTITPRPADVAVTPTDTPPNENADTPSVSDSEPDVVASVPPPLDPDDMEPRPLRDCCVPERIDPRPEPYVAVVHTSPRPATPDRPGPPYYLQEEVTLTDANCRTYRVALMILPYSRP